MDGCFERTKEKSNVLLLFCRGFKSVNFQQMIFQPEHGSFTQMLLFDLHWFTLSSFQFKLLL